MLDKNGKVVLNSTRRKSKHWKVLANAARSIIAKEYQLRELRQENRTEKYEELRKIRSRYNSRIQTTSKQITICRNACLSLVTKRDYEDLKSEWLYRQKKILKEDLKKLDEEFGDDEIIDKIDDDKKLYRYKKIHERDFAKELEEEAKKKEQALNKSKPLPPLSLDDDDVPDEDDNSPIEQDETDKELDEDEKEERRIEKIYQGDVRTLQEQVDVPGKQQGDSDLSGLPVQDSPGSEVEEQEKKTDEKIEDGKEQEHQDNNDHKEGRDEVFDIYSVPDDKGQNPKD